MKCANLIEQSNGKRLGSRITLRLKFPAYYPPVGTSARPSQIRIGKVGILVDSEIVLSTSYGKTMVFINKNLINRDRLSTRPYQQRPLINKVDSW